MYAIVYKVGITRSSSDKTAYEAIIRHPLLQREEGAKSYHALFHYYNLHATYHSTQNDFANAYRFSKKLIVLVEERPHMIEAYQDQYVSVLHNFISHQAELNMDNEIFSNLKKMRAIRTKSDQIKSRIFYSANVMELQLYYTRGEFEKGLKLVPSVREGMNHVVLSERNRAVLRYVMGYTCFGAGEYSAAIGFLNQIINDPLRDVRTDLHCFARILHLIAHYESGSRDLLEYSVRSVHRFLYKRNRLYKVETSVLNFIRNKIPRAVTQKSLINEFKELKSELEEITRDMFEKKALVYFDVISWLESKISGIPFADIVRNKAMQNTPIKPGK